MTRPDRFPRGLFPGKQDSPADSEHGGLGVMTETKLAGVAG